MITQDLEIFLMIFHRQLYIVSQTCIFKIIETKNVSDSLTNVFATKIAPSL